MEEGNRLRDERMLQIDALEAEVKKRDEVMHTTIKAVAEAQEKAGETHEEMGGLRRELRAALSDLREAVTAVQTDNADSFRRADALEEEMNEVFRSLMEERIPSVRETLTNMINSTIEITSDKIEENGK